jgi:hypothetical protein
MKDFLRREWSEILSLNGLNDFDTLWNLDAPWFEPPNQRRGGWSGVSRCEVAAPSGEKLGLFLKRQENHKTFSWRHPIKGIPTFLREFQRITQYQACEIPALEPVYFAMRTTGNGHRAILMTEELSGFSSLENHVQGWLKSGAPPSKLRRNIVAAIARSTRRIHECRIQHNCYYPKHIFVRVNPDASADVRVIDLEKSRWRPFSLFCTLRDLDTLNRHSPNWSRGDRLRFFKIYLRTERLTPYARWLWRRLAVRSISKPGTRA